MNAHVKKCHTTLKLIRVGKVFYVQFTTCISIIHLHLHPHSHKHAFSFIHMDICLCGWLCDKNTVLDQTQKVREQLAYYFYLLTEKASRVLKIPITN